MRSDDPAVGASTREGEASRGPTAAHAAPGVRTPTATEDAYNRGWWHGFGCAITAAVIGNLFLLPLVLR